MTGIDRIYKRVGKQNCPVGRNAGVDPLGQAGFRHARRRVSGIARGSRRRFRLIHRLGDFLCGVDSCSQSCSRIRHLHGSLHQNPSATNGCARSGTTIAEFTGKKEEFGTSHQGAVEMDRCLMDYHPGQGPSSIVAGVGGETSVESTGEILRWYHE